MLASLLWRCLTVPSLLQLCYEPTRLFSLLSTKPAESFSVLSSQRRQDVFLHSFWGLKLRFCANPGIKRLQPTVFLQNQMRFVQDMTTFGYLVSESECTYCILF